MGPAPTFDHAAIVRLANDGLTIREIAERIGCSRATVGVVKRKYGVSARRVHRKADVWPVVVDRNAAIVRARTDGATYQAIADQFGMTRERVRQLLCKHAPATTGSRPRPRYYRKIVCAQCGTCFKREWSQGLVKYCGRACARKARNWDVGRRKAEMAIALRLTGMTWAEVTIAVTGGKSANTGTAFGLVRLYARKTGTDLSHLFGRRHYRKSSSEAA